MGRAASALVLFATLWFAACGGPSEDGPDRPAGPTIEIVEPASEEVAPVFTLEVEVAGVELALGPNEELVPGKAHWHASVDGAGLPFAYGTRTAEIGPLSAGNHTLEVSLYHNDADAAELARDRIDLVIEE